MRKNILLLALLTIVPTIAQEDTPQQWFMRARVLQVDQGDVVDFEKAVAKKTKMFNSEDDQPRWITFRILSGTQANNYLRMQLTTDISDFDNEDIEGNQYWEKTVGPLHTSLGNRYWQRSNWASYVPENPKQMNLRRIIYYNYKDEGEEDFWRFRGRVKRAMTESGYASRMSVLVCNSGCNGNVVQVRFHHDGFAGQNSDYGEPLQSMISKYNELFGEDAYEQDSGKASDALEENGRSIRHHELIPELSSGW